MAINPNIPLSVRTAQPVSAFLGGRQARNALAMQQAQLDQIPMQNELAGLQLESAQNQLADANQLREMRDDAVGAFEAKALLQKNPYAASSYIKKRMATVEDSSGERMVLEAINNGDYESANQMLDSVISTAQRFGAVSIPKTPERNTAVVKPGDKLVDADTGASIADNPEGVSSSVDVKALLKRQYPTANDAEIDQLSATVEGAKTTADGMKQAGKKWEAIETTKKGNKVIDRAKYLLERLRANPELKNVVGSLEGSGWIGSNTWLDKEESNAVADINELRNILTADNLDMMTGVLSESDIAIIADVAGGGLTRTRDDKTFLGEIDQLYKAVTGERLDTGANAFKSSSGIEFTVK